MTTLPEPPARQPHATQAGQPTPLTPAEASAEAARLIREAYQPTEEPRPLTSYRDTTPVPAIGDAPPTVQPGRTPMSQKATDVSVMMLSAGLASLPIGGMTALVIYTLGNADPAALAIGASAPAALTVPIVALSILVKRVKQTAEAAPPVHHHHYEGTVVQDHRTVHTTTRGLWANTRNQLPK